MTLPVVLGALALLLVAGCGADTVAGKPATTLTATVGSPATTTSTASAPSTGSTPSEQAPADACFDGECELTVSEPVEVRVDPKLGFSTLSVEVTDTETVQFHVRGDGTSGSGAISGGGRVQFDDVVIEVKSFSGDAVTLDLSRAG